MKTDSVMNHPEHPTDNQLLDAYVKNGDESAFATLARRHMDMLFSVNLRRSRNRQLAEEATQNVLLSLAKKARKLSKLESNILAWLHQCSRFEVAKLLRREERIHKREQDYAIATMNASDEENVFERLYPILDEAIDNLRPPDREVIVRRYLEEQSFSQMGHALGISEDAAQKRTSRAFEQLNLFFKRKAGVTVSAVTLAAGISQHCAEAAPAACFDFAAKAASAGLSSALTTTSTTVMIQYITAIVSATAVLGGTTVYFLSQEPDPAESASASPPAVATTTGSEPPGNAASGTTIATSDEETKPYSPNEELAKMEAMSPHPDIDEFVRRLAVKHERLLKDLTKELGLSAPQVASMQSVLDQRLKDFRAVLEEKTEPDGPPQEAMQKEKEMFARVGGMIRGVGLRDKFKDILSAEQLAGYDKFEAEDWQTQVESLAYRELAKITPVLDLTEEQKDKTFAILQKSSAETYKADADVRAVMALERGLSPAQMDLNEMEEADFLSQAFDGPNPVNPTDPAFIDRLKEMVGKQVKTKVDMLAPVLDEKQKQRYSDFLYSKSVLAELGIKTPATSEK